MSGELAVMALYLGSDNVERKGLIRGNAAARTGSPLPLWERVARMSKVKFEPGEGLQSIERAEPLTRFLTAFETTLSHKGRG